MSAVAEVLTLVRDGPTTAAVAFRASGPSRMTAGALAHWSFTFETRTALPPLARIAVAHRWPCDWGIAQAGDPSAPDYLDVRASDRSAARWWNARLHTWHPFDHVVFVELPDGLAAGASVELAFGGARDVSPGFRVQTFLEEGSPFSFRWRAREGDRWTEFAQHRIEVVGAEPFRLVATAPSRLPPGAPVPLHVRAEDRWGNPATLDAPLAVEIEAGGRALTAAIPPRSSFVRVPLPAAPPGVHRFRVRASHAAGLACESNPVEVASGAPPVHWGDLHGQSVIGCGARSIDAYYEHARDFAAADVCSHQANCFLVSGPEWDATVAANRHHHAPGRFVPYLGVEWSATSTLGGDHNVYFPADDAELRRCSHEFVADRSDADRDLAHVEDLYRHYRDSDTILAVHVGGRTANLDWHDARLDRLLEIHSTHATSEWFLLDALRRGYRMGVIAGSDGVDGRPANSHPGHMGVRNVRGGLTAILAPELSRPAIWEALRARHCYATTGERILLAFTHGTATMGDEIEASPARDGRLEGFRLHVEGTAPLERIDFFRDDACIASVDAYAAGPLSPRLRVAWRGTTAPGNWQRARMAWDGRLRVDGVRVLAASGYAFDTPDEGIVASDERSVAWRSITAGDWDGVIVELDAQGRGELAFATDPMTIRVPLDTLGATGRSFELGNPDRRLELRWLPEHEPASGFEGEFSDPAPAPGPHAYWVRVRQADGACAWSTPIFVTVGGR